MAHELKDQRALVERQQAQDDQDAATLQQRTTDLAAKLSASSTAFENAAAAAEKLKHRLKVKEEETEALEVRVAQVSAEFAEDRRTISLSRTFFIDICQCDIYIYLCTCTDTYTCV